MKAKARDKARINSQHGERGDRLTYPDSTILQGSGLVRLSRRPN